MAKLAEKIEDWQAPWETETGENEIDKGRLKRYLYGLLKDKERLQESVTEITGERDELKKAADEKAREGESEADRLKREKQELEQQLAKKSTDSVEVLKLRVALKKGLTEVQARRLVGTNEEELEADADELVASFGGSGKSGEGDNDGDDKVDPPKRQPRRRSNPGDPNPEAGSDISLEDALSKIPRL